MDSLLLRLISLCWLMLLPTKGIAKKINTDPTRPSVIITKTEKTATQKKAVKKNERLLSAIFMKQGRHQAIINNKLYQKGDFFSGKKIVAIKSNKVVLQSGSSISNLILIQPVKKLKKP